MKHIRKHCRAYFALLLLLMAAGAVYLRALPAGPAAALPAEPTPAAAAPAPEPTPVKGAAAVYADGAPVVTLSSREDAYALLDWWMDRQSAGIPKGETLLSASFEKPVSVGAAPAGVSPATPEEARAQLIQNAALCPVRCVTQTVSIEPIPFESEESKDARIPKGTRIVLQVGREGERAAVTDTLYQNGEKQGVINTARTVTLEPLSQRVAAGTYVSKSSEAPGKAEGAKGPAAPKGFRLAPPVKGEVVKNFGQSGQVMQNGLDFGAKVGAEVSAPEDGTVTFAGEWGSYGFVLELDHGDGFVTRVAPLAGCALRAGDIVEKGETLGTLASPPDKEDEPHLYFELQIGGIPYNPRQYMG